MYRIVPAIVLMFLILACESTPNKKVPSRKIGIVDIDDTSGKISGRRSGFEFKNERARKLNAKALNLIKKEQIEEALELLEKAVKIEPDNPVILSNIGLVYQRKGQFEQAIQYHNNAIYQSDSSFLIAMINLANVYLDKRAYAKSAALSKSILARTADTQYLVGSHHNLIIAQIQMNDCDAANQQLKLMKRVEGAKQLRHAISAAEKAVLNCGND